MKAPDLPSTVMSIRRRWLKWGIFGCLSVTGIALLRSTFTAQSPLPLIAAKPEGCLSCHANMTGFAPAHEPAAIGCSSCHLGDPLARSANGAHQGMTRTPGNLSLVKQTCATTACHAPIEDRVQHSLMNTMSGVISVDKYVFGENPDLDRPYVASQIGHTAADSHLRNLCVSCHLGHDKTVPGPLSTESRGGGCSACHLDYGERATEELERRGRAGLQPISPQVHPMISLQIPNTACFGCHSRSGRISTNYEGWHETLLDDGKASQLAGWPTAFRTLDDGRIFERKPADVHFERGLTCIDCHNASEVMGNGVAYAHEEAAVRITCLDCHSDQAPVTRNLTDLDPEARLVATLRGLATASLRFKISADGSSVLNNVIVDENSVTHQLTKQGSQRLSPKPLSPSCRRQIAGHQALNCNSCHSAWASQCISCHTESDPKVGGWDHLSQSPSKDTWREQAGDFSSELPTLGVLHTIDAAGKFARQVTTVAPGMILTLTQNSTASVKSSEFHRLFAPVAPHTTSLKGRTCISCHANPAALGYGKGTLTYQIRGASGEWTFEPAMRRRSEDGLPQDAWIGFLQEPPPMSTTRTQLRPFSIQEQRLILLVGACLQCHAGDDPKIIPVWADFGNYKKSLSGKCYLPN